MSNLVNIINIKKRCYTPSYTRCIPWVPKGTIVKRGDTKNNHSLPQLEPTQSTQSIRDIEPSFINKLTHDTRLLRNDHFSA